MLQLEKNSNRPSSFDGSKNRLSAGNWKLLIAPLIISNVILDGGLVNGFQSPNVFASRSMSSQRPSSTAINVSEMEKVGSDEKTGSIRRANIKVEKPQNSETLDPSTYEAMLINSWDVNPALQRGFDWEIEKMRRNFAGLQQLDDGTWIRRPSLFDFLVSKSRFSTAVVRRLDESPKPVNLFDVLILFTTNLLANVGFGPALGMAAVPDAVIQKYEGSFFSFIKGALGGDLQTLAGGPLFLLLAKYYQDYGPIFNLSFGPKSFLVVSDPVMARHILRESSPDQYCKGMLAEILEPIMGQGLIPADPATWKVSNHIIM